MAAQLKSASHGRTLVLTISNPDQRNALGPEIYAAGIEALNVADSNREVRSVVLTGAGSTFCAGGNLQRRWTTASSRRTPGPLDRGPARLDRGHPHLPQAGDRRRRGRGGRRRLLARAGCDFIVAAENAVFVMAYTSVALSPDGGGSWSLAQALPRQLASELLMSGERIGAARLQQLGVVNQVAAPGAALEQALGLAARLNERAPNALASVKDLLNEAAGAPLARQLASERDHFVRNLHHANAGIGIEAFLARRKPDYP